MLTIIGYGACYYAYGVLIGPISADTRWPDAALGAIFSATLVITGIGGMVAGRVEAGTVAVAFVLAAVLITSPGHSEPGRPASRPAGVLRAAGRSPLVRAWLAATLAGGASVNALIVYQVPVTTRAGLPLGAAAAVAGFRGLAQLAGRLPLTALTGKLGARTTLVLAYTLAAAVTLLLFAGGTLAPVLILSLLAG